MVSGAEGSFLAVRPPATHVSRLRASGIWRDGHCISDLEHWRRTAPDAPAVVAYDGGEGTTTRLTYAEYAAHVERFAGALRELGVGPGQVVAIQLPNWWRASALMLACLRVGAVVAPMSTTVRPRELGRILRTLGATVCVTAAGWAGHDHAAALARLSEELPVLRHRVVIGGDGTDGAIDFSRHFEETAWEQHHAVSLGDATVDPDRVAIVLFTSGTTGEPKGALHTLNTFYATCRPYVLSEGYGSRDAYFTPHSLTHSAGLWGGIGLPLLTGAAGILMDTWEPRAAFDLMADARCTVLSAAPPFIEGLVAEARRNTVPLPPLKAVLAPGGAVSPALPAGVAEVFGLPLRAIWGMTEATGTYTRAGDPSDWALHSSGSPTPGTELDLRSDRQVTEAAPGRLHIRGGAVCLATIGRDTGMLTVVADHDDGWFDTGDLAVPDGRGGIRVVGRVADRVGSRFMIPVLDVEHALLGHEQVSDVAVVGYVAEDGSELACAVLVPEGDGLGLGHLHEYLRGISMTEWYWPSRMETVSALPRNAFGKVDRERLRRWLAGDDEAP